MNSNKLEEKIDREFEESLQTKGNKKLAFWTLVVFFGGFVMWATLVPLDEGVPTMGKVVVETKRKAIQHSTGGTIKEMFVKEGDFVRKDQVLIKLGDAKAQSQVLIEKNTINSLEENANIQRISLGKISDLINTTKKQIVLVEEELSGIRSLVKDGYAPKVQQIKLEKELNDLVSERNELTSRRKESVQAIEELKFKLDSAKERLTIAQRSLRKLKQLSRGR